MTQLPFDIWYRLTKYLAYDDVRSLSCTCKYLEPLSQYTYKKILIIDVPSEKTRTYTIEDDVIIYKCDKPSPPYELIIESLNSTIKLVRYYDFDELEFKTHEYTSIGRRCYMSKVWSQFTHRNKLVLELTLCPYRRTAEDEAKAQKRKLKYKDGALRVFETAFLSTISM